MSWLTYPYYTPPPPKLVIVPTGNTITIMADVNYDLAQAISQDLRGPTRFLAENPDPQYLDPMAYANNLVVYAQSLTHSSYASHIMPVGWDPVKAALGFANTVFQTLEQIPVNANDPDTVSVFAAWLAKTGLSYGGHGPTSGPAGGTADTGQNAAPPNTIL